MAVLLVGVSNIDLIWSEPLTFCIASKWHHISSFAEL